MAGLNSNTKLLLHFDGVDGATETTDASDNPHSINFVGSAQLDTDYKKWGSSSLLLNGSTDYLTTPDSNDWNIVGSNDDWTVDLFIKFVSPSGQEYLVCQSEDGNNGWFLGHTSGSGLTFRVWRLGGAVVDTGVGGEIVDSNWHHIALCKVIDEYAIYLDGIQGNYDKASAGNVFNALLTIGCWGAGNALFNGHIDELRIQNSNYFNASPNVGKTDTIIVPISPYSRSSLINQAIIIT